MDILKQNLSKINAGKVLDVGTGRGEFIALLKDLLNSYTDIIGIDQTTRSIEVCKEKFKDDDRIQFIQMNAEKMDFNDQTFDTVCISNSLHHLPSMMPILQEMKRVLKPCGRLIINEMFSNFQTNEQMSHVMIHHWFAKIDSILGNYHNITFQKDEIIDVFNKLNLNDRLHFTYEHHSDNPMDEETYNYFNNLIEVMLEKVKDNDNYESLKKEGSKIMDWIRKYGFQSATELMVIGTK